MIHDALHFAYYYNVLPVTLVQVSLTGFYSDYRRLPAHGGSPVSNAQADRTSSSIPWTKAAVVPVDAESNMQRTHRRKNKERRNSGWDFGMSDSDTTG
jgi:hypothetical protein